MSNTIDYKLQGRIDAPRSQRKVMYDNLPVEAMDEFHALSACRSQEPIEEFDDWLARRDRAFALPEGRPPVCSADASPMTA